MRISPTNALVAEWRMPIPRPVSIPTFLYGTAWKEDRTPALVELALRTGFRAIDTANQRRHYFEAGVGEGLAAAYRAGVVTRADLFSPDEIHLPSRPGPPPALRSRSQPFRSGRAIDGQFARASRHRSRRKLRAARSVFWLQLDRRRRRGLAGDDQGARCRPHAPARGEQCFSNSS